MKREQFVQQVLQRVRRFVKCSPTTEVAVIFVNDQKMRQLNRKYRGKNKTTNVLAFATQTDIINWRFDIRESKKYPISNIQYHQDLGDIFISLPEARREAKKYGWTINYEITRLTAHGFLHLLGYDHGKEKEANKMEALEKRICSTFRV